MDGRLCRQAFKPRWTSEPQTDFGHIWKKGTRKAQASPACTQPIQDAVRSWVRCKRVWFGGRERGKLILRFLPGLFCGKCPTEMTHHPNEKNWVGAIRCMPWKIGREKTPTPKQEGLPRQTNKQNSPLCLVMGSDTQTVQWWSTSTPRPDKGG